jgi:pilus retraction protein PilT
MEIKDYFAMMVEKGASDMFYKVGAQVRMRIAGRVEVVGAEKVSAEEANRALQELATEEQRTQFAERFDIDFAVTLFIAEGNYRFRTSVFMQRGAFAMVVRMIRSSVDDFKTLNLPEKVLTNLASESRGLVLLTGSAGSGKSTTIASLINYINANLKKHILTVEEPIEYLFLDRKSMINQRELGMDVGSYEIALKAFTLQSPDVIFIGNIRDAKTMFAALNAAETGVLVLSTLHTVNAAQTIERIINFFPMHQHNEIRMQLSLLLKGIIAQRLVPTKDELIRRPACEVMINTPTIARLVRGGKTWEGPQFIEEGALFGMQSFNQALVSLVTSGEVTEATAAEFSDNREELGLMLRGIK